MSLKQRVAKLERQAGVGPCPECDGFPVTEVHFSEIKNGQSPQTKCPSCGRALPCVVMYGEPRGA